LLGADKTTVELGVVDRRTIGPRTGRDLPTRLGEERLGGFLEAALGQPEHEQWCGHRHAATPHAAITPFKMKREPCASRVTSAWMRPSPGGEECFDSALDVC